ncbi:MAG: right-handed parallel beta-helix repeat-containing protein, partial [Alphaproteobacteria bacterium]|nr:right-handed parallel beta-helix repeat-containing protein [Alphaproteobacteria bacterium]
TGNAVSMTGGEGIYIRSRNGNSSYAGVFDNRVLLAGGNGILISGIDGESDVPLRLLGAEGHGDYGWSVNVDGNDVAMMAKNGIYVRNSGPVRIANNDTFMTGMGDELTGTIEFVNGLASGTIAPAFGPPTKSFFGPRFTWNWGDGDGIRVEDIEGTGPLGLTVEIVDNDVAASGGHGIFAGDIGGVTIIGGNTVSDSGLDITKIKGYSSLGSLLTKGPFDDESGFFGTGDNLPTRRDLWSGQDMTDVLMSYVPAPYSVEYDGHDGIHVHDVYGSSYENTGHNLYVVGNTVNGSGDDGVEIHEASASLLVSGNTITDSGLGNTGERGGDAIHIRDIEPASGDAPEGYVSGGSEEGYSGYAVNVTGNMIDNTQDDGIEILNAPSVYVATNILSDIGSAGHGLLDFIFGSGNDNADGIHIGNVGQNTRDAKVEISGEIHGGPYIDPFAVVVDANEIYTASDDGIEVLDSGRTRISGNTIEDVGAAGDRSGGDGIHVAGISNGFHISPGISEVGPYGYAVEITGNTVDGTGDDGIEVLDSESALIDTNHIYNVGYGYGWNGLLDFFFNHGFHDNADAIHVEDVHGGEYSGTTIDENVEEYAVLVTNNEIEHASDDGIEIEDAGRTRIASNTIMDVGFGNPSRSGGDGIHVRNVYADGYGPFSGPKLLGALEDGDVYSVEIVGNRVDTVADDGIQILWSGNVLVDSNQISNTGHEGGVDQWGADGIHILNGWLDGDYKEPYFLITSADVTNNTVTAAGDDGIDIEGVSGLLVDTNTISGALDDGIAVLGYAGFGASEPSQPEEGPFEEIFLVGDSEGPVEELPPFVFVVTNNDVSDSGADGIQVEGFDALDLSDNTVSGSLLNGVLISGAYNGYAGFQGNTLTDNPVGARFESGLIDMSDLTRPNLVNSGGVGGRVGYQFDVADLENPAGLALVNNTFGSTEFTGFTDLGSFYIRLENGSFLSGGAPVLLNGLFASYDTIVPASFPGLSLPPSTLKFIEDRLFDADDALVNGRGQIFTGFPQTAGLDNIEDFFSKFGAFGGSQRGVNVTINGLPPVQLSANNLGGITPFAGGPEDIEPAAGEEEGGEPQNPQDIEPAAGGEEVSCWSESANAAASGQSSTYSFGGADPEADLSATANCGSRAL